MGNLEKINKLPIKEVLSKLGYYEGSHYKVIGNNIRMKDENGKISDGWIGSIRDNRLYMKSGYKPGRFEGDIFGIIKGALGLNDNDCFKWAESNFDIKNEFTPVKKNKMSLSSKFKEMSILSEGGQEYLKARGIRYDKVSHLIREQNGYISLEIKDNNLVTKAIQSRAIDDKGDKKNRYRIEKDGSDGTGLFISLPNKEKKVIFLVEGMSDFLTIAQFGVNTIGLVSALTGSEYLREWHNNYELVYIPDTDEAGTQSINKLRDQGIKFSHTIIGAKDVNDLWCSYEADWEEGINFLTMLYDIREKKKSNLELALEDVYKIKSGGIIPFGDSILDKMMGGLARGSCTLINGPSGQGKTTFSYHLLRTILKNNKNIKVAYYSLETRIGRQLMQILSFLAGKSESEIYANIEDYTGYLSQLSNLEVYDDIFSLEGIKEHITNNNIDVAFIDFCQKVNIEGGGDEYSQMKKYGQDIQSFAIQNKKVHIISLSQTNMGNYNTPLMQRMPKGSGALFESSDTTINIGKEDGKNYIAFMKTKTIGAKGWYTLCEAQYNRESGEYLIFPNIEQNTTISEL